MNNLLRGLAAEEELVAKVKFAGFYLGKVADRYVNNNNLLKGCYNNSIIQLKNIDFIIISSYF